MKNLFATCRLAAGCFLTLVLSAGAPHRALADAQAAPLPLNSWEVKMLLNPAMFADEDSGAASFWRLARSVAAGQGLAVNGTADDKTVRHLAYLDTADFAFNKKGYILRLRQAEPVTYPQGALPKSDLTLKFRSADQALSASKDVSPAPGVSGKGKFEDDVVFQDGALKDVFSKSAKIDAVGFSGKTVEQFAGLYPALGTLWLAPAAAIGVVNDKRVEEHVFEPGTITLPGGVMADAALTVWRFDKAGEPCIAEFSFAFAAAPEPAETAARAYMTALAKAAGDWTYHGGGTKTELIYGPGNGGGGD